MPVLLVRQARLPGIPAFLYSRGFTPPPPPAPTQCRINHTDNACKFSEAGAGEVSVTISRREAFDAGEGEGSGNGARRVSVVVVGSLKEALLAGGRADPAVAESKLVSTRPAVLIGF